MSTGNNFLTVFEDEVKEIWGDIKELAVDETKAVWNTFKTTFLAIKPEEMLNDVIPTLEKVFGDIVIHDYANALQKVYEYAELEEAKGVLWLKTLTEHEVTAIMASWQASKLAKVIK